MRKDSLVFLKKLLEYRNKINKDSFELNYQYFIEIPNIEANLHDIMRDLINNACLSSNSQVMNLEGDIKIYLTLDGITYLEEEIKQEPEPCVVINVSDGGTFNIANDHGSIEAVQNNNIENINDKFKNDSNGDVVDDCKKNEILQSSIMVDMNHKTKSVQDCNIESSITNIENWQSYFIEDYYVQEDNKENWMKIIDKWCKWIDIDNWEVWTSYLFGSGKICLCIEDEKRLQELKQWMLKIMWPEEGGKLKDVLSYFSMILNDFLVLFHEYSVKKRGAYFIKQFYRVDPWNNELYDELLNKYNNHINLIQDMVLELTRVANYVCDIVKHCLDSKFRINEKQLYVVVVVGLSMDESDELHPEYRNKEKETFKSYEGLERFKQDRYCRDICFGDVKENSI